MFTIFLILKTSFYSLINKLIYSIFINTTTPFIDHLLYARYVLGRGKCVLCHLAIIPMGIVTL